MLTAYTASTDIDFQEALSLARLEYPQIDLSEAIDPTSLERILLENGQIMFVDINFDIQNLRAISEEASLAREIEATLDTMDCPPPDPIYTEKDIDFDPCETPAEFPPVPEPGDIDVELDTQEIENILEAQGAENSSTLDCMAEMAQIADNINALNAREQLIRETHTSLEELLYNYRIMETFFRKRSEVLNRILNTFNPLVARKREIEARLEEINPQYDIALADFTAADALVSDGSYTNAEYNDWVNKSGIFNNIDAIRNQLLVEQQTVLDSIAYERSVIEPFNNELYTDAEDILRQGAVIASITALFTNTNSIFGTVGAFSSRVELKKDDFFYDPFGGSGNPFSLRIRNKFVDPLGILVGRPKRYLNRVTLPEEGIDPAGTLYERMYNIWGDIDRFFTLEERGLTNNMNAIDADLKDTGADNIDGKFIGSLSTYSDFYQNFAKKWSDKVALVKRTVIEPALSSTVRPLELFAEEEITILLAFGRTYEELPSDGASLSQVVNFVRTTSEQFLRDATELRADISTVERLHAATLKSIEAERVKYTQTPCAKNTADKNEGAGSEPGTDPLGVESLRKNDPTSPSPMKWCYWLKFSALTTAVNILPLPGTGGYRYWPIGFTIPTPAKLIKIPLPIVWIPISVIPLPVGLFVIFIAQCGICPSPVVFFQGPNGEKKFIISLRPGTEFGSNADKPALKRILEGGIAAMTKIDVALNDIKIPEFKPIIDPSSAPNLLDDIKSTILAKVNKLGLPDVAPLNIGTNSTVAEKKAAFKKMVMEYLSKMDVPSIKIPKSGTNVNPKPLPINDIIDMLNRLMKMKLPTIAIPEGATMDLTDKMFSKVKSLKVPDLNLDIPEINSPEYPAKVRVAMKKVMQQSLKLIDAPALGIVAVADEGLTFFNPFKCGPEVKGLKVPPIPSSVTFGITALGLALDLAVNGLSDDFIRGLGPINLSNIPNKTIDALAGSIPTVEVPNPSKVSLKDMMMDSAKKVAKIQLPSLPDPTKLIQPRITIPGEAVEATILKSVEATIGALPGNDINIDMSPIDAKTMIIDIIESSFKPLETFLNPFLDIISIYGAAKDKTFPEILGLAKCSPDASVVPFVEPAVFEQAMETVAKLSIVPYPAVCVAPAIFQKAHPVLNHDDLPPWERLTLKNFLFVAFLDQWNVQGKKTCGFFELP